MWILDYAWDPRLQIAREMRDVLKNMECMLHMYWMHAAHGRTFVPEDTAQLEYTVQAPYDQLLQAA